MISSEVRRVRSHESNRVPKWATARGPGRHENLRPRHLWRSACRLMIEPSGACHSNGPCMAAFGLIDTLGSPELLHARAAVAYQETQIGVSRFLGARPFLMPHET